MSESDFSSYDCLVVFSGGQDSTTCLFWALKKFKSVRTVFFRYGQRHSIEEESAKTIAEKWDIPIDFLDISTFSQIGGNSLVDSDMEISQESADSLPNTFVPGRNLVFLTYAAALAYQHDIHHLVTGVCETDYSGYPDCRENTMNSLAQTLTLGMGYDFQIHTPLMHLNKAQTVELAKKYDGLEALAWSHTCYEGLFPPCGKCPSCLLRAKGFEEAGVEDPLTLRAAQ